MAQRFPKTLQQFQREFPRVWKSYEALRESCGRAGPLDRKTVELIRVAVEVAKRRHGGLIAHLHRAKAAGATHEEIWHAVMLSLPLIGFPDVLEAFKIVTDALK